MELYEIIFDALTILIAAGALGFSLYEHYVGRKERKRLEAARQEDALAFVRDFNNDEWPPAYTGNNEQAARYWKDVDRLRGFRSSFPNEMKPLIDAYLEGVSHTHPRGRMPRAEELKKVEYQFKKTAKDLLKKMEGTDSAAPPEET